MHSIAIALTWSDTGQVCMPGECVDLLELNPAFSAGVVKEAQVHRLRNFRKEGEVRPRTVKDRAEGIAPSGPRLDPISVRVSQWPWEFRRSQRSKAERKTRRRSA